MSVLGDVFGSLESMSQLQLLLAFITCIGYAFAQGSLLLPRGRRAAWFVTAFAASGFAFESPDWTLAAMLLVFALAGMGSFVALVWLTSRALGFGTARRARPTDVASTDAGLAASPAAAKPRVARPSEHAHSL